MTDRRGFLARLAQLTALAVVTDPAELVEMLAPRRLYVPGANFTRISAVTIDATGAVTVAELDAMLREIYTSPFRDGVMDKSGLAAAFAPVVPKGGALLGYLEVSPHVTRAIEFGGEW